MKLKAFCGAAKLEGKIGYFSEKGDLVEFKTFRELIQFCRSKLAGKGEIITQTECINVGNGIIPSVFYVKKYKCLEDTHIFRTPNIEVGGERDKLQMVDSYKYAI